ncbi:MAG: hypothetical protein AAF242_13295 [Bacteroidota bacterium]
MTTTFIKADYYIQIFLIICLLATAPFLLPIILFAPALGGWQVFSALVKGIAMNNYRYRVFALLAGLFGTGLMMSLNKHDFIFNTIFDALSKDISETIGLVCFVLIPLISAITYFTWTRKDFLEATQ